MLDDHVCTRKIQTLRCSSNTNVYYMEEVASNILEYTHDFHAGLDIMQPLYYV